VKGYRPQDGISTVIRRVVGSTERTAGSGLVTDGPIHYRERIDWLSEKQYCGLIRNIDLTRPHLGCE
jgi:hypothetical protein